MESFSSRILSFFFFFYTRVFCMYRKCIRNPSIRDRNPHRLNKNLEKLGVTATRIPKLSPSPPILSNERGQKIQPGICQNLYFTGERASRTSSRRTATKPLRSFRKRKHRRNSNQSRFTPITTVPLEAISTAPDRSTSITERKNWSRLFTPLSATR